MREQLIKSNETWPGTLILVSGAMLLTSWFPPLWFFVLPPIIKARQRVKVQRQQALWMAQHNRWAIEQEKQDRAFIAAMRSV